MCTTKEELVSWVEKVLDKEGLKKVELELHGKTDPGSGYMGDIVFLTANCRLKDGSEKKYNFVIKHGKRGEIRVQVPVRDVFLNEFFLYDKVFPKIIKFQMEKNIEKCFDCVPKCYGTISENSMEVIIFENLLLLGYQLHDRTVPMSVSHIKLVLKEYAKFHATSLTMKDQKPEEFWPLARRDVDLLAEFLKIGSTIETFKNATLKVINYMKENGMKENAEKLDNIRNKLVEILSTTADPEDPYSVILHGDCWNNNFMFRYKDEQKTEPEEVRILDWQISHVASPIYDLSYFLFSVSGKEQLDRFEELNRYYHKTLSDFIRQLGSDPEKLYPYSAFMDHWRTYGRFGVLFAPMILKFELCDQEDAPDFAESINNGGDFGKLMDIGVKNEKEYFRRAVDVITHAAEWNLI